MKIYLSLGAAILLIAAGWTVRGWRDEADTTDILSHVQAAADRQREQDELKQALLSKQLTEFEGAYENQVKIIPELPILNRKIEHLSSCVSAPAFSPEFVRLWNSDPGDATGAEQAY
jgi:hypothetical protein